MLRVWCVAAFCLAVCVPAAAQQPFVVDDADVTAWGDWHVEISNQVDRLKVAAYPTRWQNTFESELDVGVADRVEVAVISPLISLIQDPRASVSNVTGLGDTGFAVKVRLTESSDAKHAFAGSLSLELPTGDRARELGSGLIDYGINGVSQHRLRDDLILRLNVGTVFAGNTQTGLIGIRQRGTVLTGGGSLVRKCRPWLDVGAEVTAAWSRQESIRESAIGWQVASSILLRDGVTLDLGLAGGSSSASPKIGFQVGTSIDLIRHAPAEALTAHAHANAR